jgi:hypothetical protein
MLSNAVKIYADRAIAALISAIVGAFVLYLVMMVKFIPEATEHMNDLSELVRDLKREVVLRDSLIIADYGRIMAQVRQHDVWLNGGDSGKPGIRTEVYTNGIAIGDIWGEIQRAHANR